MAGHMLDFVLPNIDDKMTKIQKIQRTSFILEIFKANLFSLIFLSENHTYIVYVYMKFLSLELFSSQTNNGVGPLGFRIATDLWSDLFAKRFFFCAKNNEDGGKNKNSNGNGAMEDEVARGR